MKMALKLALCILGAIIGAGFATGREISSFFVRYGCISIWGIVLTSLLIGVYVYFVMKKIKTENISSPYEYLCSISNKPFAYFSMIITYIFLFVSFSVMITGGGEILEELFSLSHLYAVLVVSAICCLVLIFGKNGVLISSSFLTPIMMLGILWLGIVVKKDIQTFANSVDNYVTSSIVYVSYNTLPLLTLICSFAPCCKSDRAIKLLSAALTMMIFVLMAVLWYVLIKSDPIYLEYNMPIVKIAQKNGEYFEKFYIGVLFFSMLTTAFSSGIGILTFMDKKIKNTNNTINAMILCLLALAVSYVGFARFIDIVYPFFGYLGLSVFLLIFFDILRFLKKNNKIKRK